MLLLDVDGVFTDGGIVYAGEEVEAKKFDVKDGMGIVLLQRTGLEVGIITGRVSDAVRRRANELGVEEVYQGYDEKTEALDTILEERDLSEETLGFMGDDVQDLPVLERVGLTLAPADAHPLVRERVDYVTESPGGSGAIRNAVDFLLKERNDYEEVYGQFP
jgi:3-deoxy-D-manno-octulosonate 8-phosphate phosphatase (KDO 8-P phosphatase)